MSCEGSLWHSSMGYRNCLFQFCHKITKNEESSESSVRGQFSRQSFSWQHCSLGKSSNGSCWDLSVWLPQESDERKTSLPTLFQTQLLIDIICSLKFSTSEAALTTMSRQNNLHLLAFLLYCLVKRKAVCPGAVQQVAAREQPPISMQHTSLIVFG